MAGSWRRRRKWLGNASSGCKNSTSRRMSPASGRRHVASDAGQQHAGDQIRQLKPLDEVISNCRLLRCALTRRRPCSLVDGTTNFLFNSESAKTHSCTLQHGYERYASKQRQSGTTAATPVCYTPILCTCSHARIAGLVSRQTAEDSSVVSSTFHRLGDDVSRDLASDMETPSQASSVSFRTRSLYTTMTCRQTTQVVGSSIGLCTYKKGWLLPVCTTYPSQRHNPPRSKPTSLRSPKKKQRNKTKRKQKCLLPSCSSSSSPA